MLARVELENPVGFYTPSFFRIYIDTDQSLAVFNDYKEETSAAFIHEYIHYLQDLTTVYGLMNISYIVDFIKTVNSNQLQNKSRNLEIPYELSAEKDKNVFYNSQLTTIYSGTIKNVNAKLVEKYEVETKIISLPSTDGNFLDKAVKVVKLKGITHTNESFEYYFGSHSIMETMAYEIEIMTHGKVIEDPASLPYKAGRYLADLVYPYFADVPELLVALCDWSLMYFNPGAQFIEALELMWNQNYYPDKPSDLYAYLGNSFKMEYEGTSTYTDLFNQMSDQSLEQLKSYFTTEIFAVNRSWLEAIFKHAKEIRNQYPDFVLQLAQGGNLKRNETFNTLIARLGTPIVTNRANRAIIRVDPQLDLSNIEPEAFWAIGQIYALYTNSIKSKSKRCNMVEWCRESCAHLGIPDYTDDRCINSPWKKVNDKPICAFCEVWKTWGMQFEIPVERVVTDNC